MNWPQPSFKRFAQRTPRAGLVVVVLVMSSVGGCSLFGGRANPNLRDSILETVPIGTSMDSAESTIADRGFSCSQNHGGFIDDDGIDHEVGHYLGCVKRPGPVSFKCMYRDQVYVVAKNDTVGEIYVARGPSCFTR